MSASRQFLDAILSRKKNAIANPEEMLAARMQQEDPAGQASFANHPILKEVRLLKAAAKRVGVGDPFFRVHEGAGGAHTVIAGREYINFSHYNYLGLNNHPEVNAAAKEAIDIYGTSAGASRLVAGERPVQRQLEIALADFYGAEDCVVFVSGHATNVSAIATLFGPRDIVFHDSLIHNSVLEGIKSSGATRRSFPHNNLRELEKLLSSGRSGHDRALIVAEGHYSMDGDLADLPGLVRLKSLYDAFLMVDEAHSLGVLGETGRGIAEHYGVDSQNVDIWMGTLSKTLASCGGYIAGSRDLVEILKSAAPGFVYSVGISPPLAAASLTALGILRREPERVAALSEKAGLFLRLAKEASLNTGASCGKAIIPVILGSSKKAITLSNKLFEHGINVQPIIHPAVEEQASRLRFFLNVTHTEDDIQRCCELTARLLAGKGM